jgi:nanoRNase/pAp phosphatase (c-di-AMP/oligoRNAs hydrolase)
MLNLLDIHIDTVALSSVHEYDRVAMVDVQPHYFGGLVDRVDLVIDHHPELPGYTAVFKDVRPEYGSTSTILTEHLRAVDVNISERTATAMLYAIKSDTLFFNRQANRADIEAFSFLYPLADAALIRKMEGAEITTERLEYVMKAYRGGTLADQVFCGFLGTSPREDFIPYVADFFLQLENVKWTVIAGIVNDALVVSVRNLGYTKNAGEFVRRFFADVGSAGGHRAMAKAVVPMQAFRGKFGDIQADRIAPLLHDVVAQFLHEPARDSRETKEAKTAKSDGRGSELIPADLRTEQEVKAR